MGRSIAEIVASKDFLIGNPRRFQDYSKTYIPLERLVHSIAGWRIHAEATAKDDEQKRLHVCNRIATRTLEKYLRSEEKARQLIAAERVKIRPPCPVGKEGRRGRQRQVEKLQES